jgi:signal transduction histidine kinase
VEDVQAGSAASPHVVLPQLRLDELLDELQHRLSDVRSTRDRVHALLEAVLAVGSDLDLQTVLKRITEAASTLAQAQYAALGVIGDDGQLSQFVTVGVDEETHARIGSLPRGHGILGLLIRQPQPLRLKELGEDPAAYGFPPNHPPMNSFLGVPIRVRGAVFGNLYLTEKLDGGTFDDEDESVVLALASAAGVAIENARLYDRSRRREAWLSASADISTQLLQGADPEAVLQLVAAQAREITGAGTSFIALPQDEERLLVEVVDGPGAEALLGAVLRIDGTPCGRVLSEGQAVFLNGSEAGEVLASGPVGSALLVPLGAAGAVRAVLSLTTPAGEAPLPGFTVQELSIFAAHAALALEVADRRRDAERLVVFEDRDRIARDLHDLVIQRLFATGMQLESAARMVAQPEAAGRVRRAVDDLDGTIREIRSTIYALTAQPQDTRSSLRGRLFDVVDAGAEQLGFTPSVKLTGLVDTAVSPEVAEQVLAVLREALSNAARHANAHRVEVILDVGDVLRLTVRDDGAGLPPQLERRSGLANMVQRAAGLGGTFEVESAPGSGTQLQWVVPVLSEVEPAASS